ncbi:MAG TPA: hypothetical protein VND66_08950 [Acidobacteriaceae bacterium]|nr:hypothetical protein [Acidobacteriaceae bacterium]
MTTSQLYLAIFVPCFSILIVWLGSTLSNRQGMKSLSKSIDDLGTSLRSEMATLALSLRAEMKTGFDAVDQRLTRFEATVDRIDGEIRIDHERRIVKLEEKILSKAS